MIIALWVLFISSLVLGVLGSVALFRGFSIEGLLSACFFVSTAVIVGMKLLGQG